MAIAQYLTTFVRIAFGNSCQVFDAKYLQSANLTDEQNNKLVSKDWLETTTSNYLPKATDQLDCEAGMQA